MLLRLLLTLFALLLVGCADSSCGYAPASGGAKLYYESCGSGEAVLLLHGHSLDRRMWEEQVEPFVEAGYRVVRFDFRGYGRSSDQSEHFQFTHMEDVLAVMDHLSIDRAHLVGLSMGGFVGADLVAMHPERLLSAVLVSGNLRNSPGPSTPMDVEEAARRDREIAALREKGVAAMKREWFEALMASGGSQRERMREPLWQMIEEWSAWQPLHKEVRVIVGLDARAALETSPSEVPVLLVEGYTTPQPPQRPPRMLYYLKNGEVAYLSDCGHMLSMEQPERFNRVVLDFLERVER